MMASIVLVLTAGLVLVGSFFAFSAAIGLVRLPDLYCRMHAASKAGTVGSGLMLIALGIHASELAVTTRSVAGVIFFLLTAPVSAHLLAKAAYSVGYRMTSSSIHDDMKATTDMENAGEGEGGTG